MKKIKMLLISSLLLVLTLSLTPIVSHAATPIDCSGAVECRGVYLERGDQTASTNTLYFSKGSMIDWGVNNAFASKGQFQVSVNLWRLTPMTLMESHIVPFGGNKTYHFPVTVSGNYAVVVQSGDYSQGRSYAFGWLSR